MCFGGWKKSKQKKIIYKFLGNKIWRMANIFKFGGNIIWQTPEKRKFWRELNLADFYQIRQFRQIFFPPKFLPLRYFCIWVARNSKVLSPDIDLIETTHPPVKARKKGKEKGTSDSIKKSTPPHSEPPKSPARTELPKSNEASTYHAGFINKGNTCYANSILQVLSVIPALWSQLPSESSHLSPLVKSISLNMSLIKRSSSLIDPSNFLRALARSISLSRGTAFDFNSQHDVPEMLHVVLDELKGMSPRADSLIATTTQTSLTCDTFFCSSVKERKDDMLLLPTSKHVSSSFIKLLQTESLSGDNKWFCPQCSSYQISTKEYHKLWTNFNCALIQISRLR